MKKIIILLIAIIFNFKNVFGYDYIYSEQSINSLNNANLIQAYIYRLELQTNSLVKKYEIESYIVNQNIGELNNLLLILKNLENKEYSNDEYNKIIKAILGKLKIYKDNIKNVLKEEKDIYEKNYNKKIALFDKIGKKLNGELNIIIVEYYKKYEKKSKLTQEDNNIIQILKNLYDESLKLKNFSKINFSSISEMTDSFGRILKNIKREMLKLKKDSN